MSRWIFEKAQLEQVIIKAPNPAEEEPLRRRTISFMQEAGQRLGMPMQAIATAIVFFQRYFALRTVATPDRLDMATTALFLASKVEDMPKKLCDVICKTRRLHDSVVGTGTGAPIAESSPEYAAIRERVLQLELELLKHLSFDMTVEHPYKTLVSFARKLRATSSSMSAAAAAAAAGADAAATAASAHEREKEDAESRKLVQDAWNFVNDSLVTNLSLRFPPNLISIAALFLAHRRRKKIMTVPGDQPWWVVFGVSVEAVEQICQEILSIYPTNPIDGGFNPNAVTGTTPAHLRSPMSTTPSPAHSPPPKQPHTQQTSPKVPPRAISPKTRPSEATDEDGREKRRAKPQAESSSSTTVAAPPAIPTVPAPVPASVPTTATAKVATERQASPARPMTGVVLTGTAEAATAAEAKDVEMLERSESRERSRERYRERERKTKEKREEERDSRSSRHSHHEHRRKDRDRDRDRDREKDKDRDKGKDKERDRGSSTRERESKSKSKSRSRSRSRSRDREHKHDDRRFHPYHH
jgi:cyclin T